MAISGKFVADFASFYDAVSKAEVSLRSFETGASKVESSLNRMADSFSGRKIIQDATLMAEAVEQIGGVSKLTESELQRLGGTVGGAVEKMKLMGIEVPPEIQKIATELHGVDAAVDTTSKKFDALATALTVTTAAQEIRRFAGDVQQAASVFVTAYAEEETAVKQLETALMAQGTATTQTIDSYRALAGAFQDTTRFSDDAMIAMQALFVQVGDVGPEQMQAAMQAAADLSVGLGIDLEQATMLVAKAFASGGENLGRLKAILGDTVPEGANMEQVLTAINEKFGGQAAADMQTYAGRMANLQNQFGEMQEKIGALLVNGLTPLLDAFGKLPQPVQTAAIGFAAIGAAVAPLALSFTSLVAAVGPLITLFGTPAIAAFGTTLLGLLGPIAAVGAAIAAAIVVWKNWDAIVSGSKAIWDGLKSAAAQMATAITQYARQTYEGIKTWIVDRFTALVGSVTAIVQSVINPFREMYNAVVGHSYVPDMVNGIASEFGRLDAVMVSPAQTATAAVTQAFGNMAGQVQATLTSLTRAGSTIAGQVAPWQQMSSGGGGGGGGFQLPVPNNFSWAQAYEDAGFFVHDSPFIGKSKATNPANFGAASLGFMPRHEAITIHNNVQVSGVWDPTAKRQLTDAVSEGLLNGVSQGRKFSA